MNNEKEIVLSIYSRPECHLCDDMVEELQKWQNRFSFKIKVINIDKSTELTERFAARIPLLAFDNTEICEYHFDENLLLQFFENHL